MIEKEIATINLSHRPAGKESGLYIADQKALILVMLI